MKLMNKIMLTCKQATFISSNRRFKHINFTDQIKHKLHLMICEACRAFDKQSRIIDQSMDDIYQNNQLLSEENLSPEKKSQIKDTINQSIKK